MRAPFRFAALLLASLASIASAQNTAAQPPTGPGDYPGTQTRTFGIFLTPVPNAPFTADEHIVTHQKLADGSDHVGTVVTHIARSSSGIVYTERRRSVPPGFQGDSQLIEGQLYDPSSRTSTRYDPQDRIARQIRLTRPPATTPGPIAPGPAAPGLVETDLGEQLMAGQTVHGLRRERTIPADRSGTGAPVVITDEYWYAPALSVYLALRHQDPRMGETLIALSQVDRHEPDASRFRVPDTYRVVDETPQPPIPAQGR